MMKPSFRIRDAAAEPPQDDTVDASIGHSGISDSNSSTSSFDLVLDWA